MILPPRLTPGDIVQFVHLHLESAKPADKKSHKKDHLVYEVEGKQRPMLICEELSKERGERWFRAFYFTTKQYAKKTIPVGRLINSEQDNFIHTEPVRCPANLASIDNKGTSIIKQLDPIEFGSLLKILNFRKA
ncbi:hypothetical protein [Bythopirellula goksoeyrii]|uniref:Uncharacterized protein n=1 Tax=Bythopirellula goksoeyrii TaxID=1400387 RepID=A0A5B9QDB4_9BACT|nr:hypothetical protein [Bythopirellula goksoeyrii]QEG36884.1 hypothetical protein Pr1d_42210 [Bythopirellula goksoeyrii]